MFKKNGKVKIIIISVKILQSSLKIKMFIFNMSLVGTGEGFQGSNPQNQRLLTATEKVRRVGYG
jgi:hypothetical protein